MNKLNLAKFAPPPEFYSALKKNHEKSRLRSSIFLFFLSFLLAGLPLDAFGQTITIEPCEAHGMSSHIIGVCRNHVQDQTVPLPPPGNNTQDFLFAEKMDLYGGITPSFGGRKLYRFGGSMVDGVPGAPWGLTGWFYPIAAGQTGPYPYDDFQFYLDEATKWYGR